MSRRKAKDTLDLYPQRQRKTAGKRIITAIEEHAEAVSLLQDLRDLAKLQKNESTFRMKMTTLHNDQVRKSTMVERFRKAKLLVGQV